LLGQLDDQARRELETELLTNDEVFEELLILEDEITDEFVGGKLAPSDRNAFEEHFLATPERHESVRFARDFQRHVNAVPPRHRAGSNIWRGFLTPKPSVVRAALSLILILAIVAGAVWLLRTQRPSQQTFATLTLTATPATRSDGSPAPKVRLPLNENALRIVLTLPEPLLPGDVYRPEIQSDFGDTRSIDATVVDERSVAITVRAAELKRAQYSIKLIIRRADGVERRISGSYLFTVE
jgi:hypothetical protein